MTPRGWSALFRPFGSAYSTPRWLPISTRPRFASSGSSSSPPPKRPHTRKKVEDKINYNPELSFRDAPSPGHVHFQRVTANDLESYKEPPTRVKMLVRDFIEDSLYNPNYGYFPKQVTIFTSSDTSINFGRMRDGAEFQEEVAERYQAYGQDALEGPGRQIWHTPTELFQPWYGHAIARCLVAEYLLKYFPYEDLVIYEIGAGNGTLALNILDYIREEYPEVYDRTQYKIIEISGNLAELQRKKLCAVHECVTVTHQSVLHWSQRENAPCFFVAMEVIDNFAHDVIRYDLKTLEPYQGLITIDEHGDFSTHYTRVTDPLIAAFLGLRQRLGHPLPVSRLLQTSSTARSLYASLPFAANLSTPEYIPTRLLNLMFVLRKYFPRHRLLLSDFSSLPDVVRPGVNAPVVQTRYQNTTVPCGTLLVKQGFFDIFFPTDFERLRDMYEDLLARPHGASVDSLARASPLTSNVAPFSAGKDFFSSYYPSNRRTPVDGVASSSGLPVGERKSSVFTHAEFLQTYADLDRTKLKNGENPILEFYQNVKFLF